MADYLANPMDHSSARKSRRSFISSLGCPHLLSRRETRLASFTTP